MQHAARPTSQPTYDIRVFYDVKVPMGDGVKLSADVWLSRAVGSFPAGLSRNPSERSGTRVIPVATWWAKRGDG